MTNNPTQLEMERNIMAGKTSLVSANVHNRPADLARSKTGNAATHDKKGGKKSINIEGKMKKVMRKVMR
jgi:hypothetical protein